MADRNAWHWSPWALLLSASLALSPNTAARAEQLVLLPKAVTLSGPTASHRLLLQSQENGEFTSQVTEGVAYSSSNPNVAIVRQSVVIPQGNGQATITAATDRGSATTTVVVADMDQPIVWTFRNHVQSVLTKSGCNSGACHGALAGKGGFKLSLRGYDTATDYLTITRQARGRRVELADPAKSLILTKPSGAIPHKGGIRFDVGSPPYQIISQWLSQGAPGPSDNDPRLRRLEILPQNAVLQPDMQQNVLVRAHYSDGRVEDVTRWAKYSSTNEVVAAVDDVGRVTVRGRGEGAITAWFASQIVIARLTSPYDHQIPEEVYANTPARNFIDELVLKKLKQLRLRPSPPAGDAEFLRRAFLDTIGALPTADEARRFLADCSPEKRDKLIEELLRRPEFVDYWSYKWSDLLLINGAELRPEAVKAYYQWIHGHVQQNTPWDQFVRQIITARGDSLENGATNFYALHQDPENMSENVSQAFLGLSIGCAKCHNHPLEKWTNDQYYAMANLFARVRAKGWGGDARNGDGKRTLYVASSGDLLQPLTGKPQPPAPLDGQPIPLDSRQDRRQHLANWLTSPDNPYFSRSITNRVWANFFGVGLVESVDDLRASNPASNEELLSAAARHLVENKFDLQALMRTILQSATYQRSSMPLAENQAEKRFYARYYPKRLMAEVLLDAISQATDVPTEFNEVVFPGADIRKTDFYPTGTRALQLYDSAVGSYFLKTFGRNQRRITCECERSNVPTMVQVLHISNGDTINEKLQSKQSRVEKMLQAKLPDEQIVDEVYLVSLSRFPTAAEKTRLLELMQNAEDENRRIVLEDLFWAVLSSREFLFNH